ncbi:MAG TPA: hypothetical protein DDW52_14670 [Planctomycetaceae bacterium]|nr:hypothetical protein [Planctomycetaceae bacterium]
MLVGMAIGVQNAKSVSKNQGGRLRLHSGKSQGSKCIQTSRARAAAKYCRRRRSLGQTLV